MISKDYENLNEFLSNEEYFCNKLVNLQIPYFFISKNQKSDNQPYNSKDKINKYNKETEVNIIIQFQNFIKKISEKFPENLNKRHAIIPKQKKVEKIINISKFN